MSVTLQISDGVTTVDLMNDFSPGVTTFTPGVSIGAMSQEDPDITESIRVYSSGTATATIYTTIRTIERLLMQAEEYQKTKAGAIVYLIFATAGSTTYRSRITKGKVTYVEDQLRINQANSTVDFQIMFTRRTYWEANVETQLELTNGSTAKTTSAVTILNHDDATSGHDDWVEIDGADVEGTMPAAVRIELTNTTGSNRDSFVFIGLATHGTPGSIPHILEGEDNSGSSDQADSSVSSNDAFGRFSTTTSWALKGIWTISAAQADALAGRYYRCVARFRNLPSATSYMYLSTHITGGTTEQTATQQTTLSITNYLQELGVLRLPPWLTTLTSLQAFDIGLNLKSSGSSNVDIDFIALVPTDGFRVIRFVDSGPQNTDMIMIDEIYGATYIQAASGKIESNLSLYGQPLMIWPGKTQRLYFLFQNNVPGMDIARTHSVKVYYRPRRDTL